MASNLSYVRILSSRNMRGRPRTFRKQTPVDENPALSCPVAPNTRAAVDARAQGWDALLLPGVAPHH